MDQEKLQSVLKVHQLWLETRFSAHIEGCRADLMYANLRDADLRHADLRDADLRYADLKYANLIGADLRGTNLKDADLRYTNLGDANLCRAVLWGVNLIGADLRDANLRGANLYRANLRDANLRNANLRDTNLRDAKNIPFIPFTCPDSGAFIGYKKANDYVVKLKILEDARRCSATGRKCRCDKAQVLSITNLDGTDANIASVSSNYDKSFIYTVGEVVEVSDFDTNRWNDCSAGIHFFINRQEAVEYYY